MTTAEAVLTLEQPSRFNSRRLMVTGGQILLAIALLLFWKWGSDTAGELFVADPIKVGQRLIKIAMNGEIAHHVYVTLRISAMGFALGCFFGVAFPFAIRRMPRFTSAIEPYILASVGVPKYALIPLFILWFGINDAPKLWLVGLLVFYPVFIAVFAGIRNVDRRLISMARIIGASEAKISREVIWNSLLPFFFASLKIALPRAVSAAIIGEFLVGYEGIGFYIEHSRQMMDVTGVFTGIVIATALVLIINMGVVWLDKKMSAWRPVERDMQL